MGKTNYYVVEDTVWSDEKKGTLTAKDLKGYTGIKYGEEAVSFAPAEAEGGSKDLVITIGKIGDGNSAKTITLKDYFTSTAHSAVSSAYKNLKEFVYTSGDQPSSQVITDNIDYTVSLDAGYKAKKVAGTVFSDTIDASAVTHALTINGGNGDDTITGTNKIDTNVDATHVKIGDKVYDISGIAEVKEALTSQPTKIDTNNYTAVTSGDGDNKTTVYYKNDELKSNGSTTAPDKVLSSDYVSDGKEDNKYYKVSEVTNAASSETSDSTYTFKYGDKYYNVAELSTYDSNAEGVMVDDTSYTQIGEYYLKTDAELKTYTEAQASIKDDSYVKYNGKWYQLTGTAYVKASTGADTINGGAGDDTITGGTGNDKLTGGIGDNTYNFKAGDGNDIINLTKGETANLIINTDKYDTADENGTRATDMTYAIKGKDLVITYTTKADKSYKLFEGNNKYYVSLPEEATTTPTGDELSKYTQINNKYYLTSDLDAGLVQQPTLADDTITIKNYATKEIAESVYVNGKNLSEDLVSFVNADLTAKKFTGTRFDDTISFDTTSKDSKITKGVTVNAGAGNDTITGTDYADNLESNQFQYKGRIYTVNETEANKYDETTPLKKGEFVYNGYVYTVSSKADKFVVSNTGNDTINGGTGDDIITGGTGNDKLTGGAGINTYNFKAGDGNDIINLTKGEQAQLVIKNAEGNNATDIKYDIVGKDLVVSYNDGKDTITLKNYGSKDVVGDGNILVNWDGQTDTATYASIDYLFNNAHKVDTAKYTGTRLNDTITINYVNAKNGKGATVSTGAGYDVVTSGTGNDTINLNGAGEKTVNIIAGSGDDVINMNTAGVEANLKFADGQALSYSKSGNNLVVESEVKYIAKATVSGYLDGVDISGDKVLTIGQYGSGKNAQYQFNFEYTSGESDFSDGGSGDRNVRFDLTDLVAANSDDGFTWDTGEGENVTKMTMTGLKIYQVVGGVETDVTESYLAATKDATDNGSAYNKTLFNYTSDTVTIKNYFANKTDSELSINGNIVRYDSVYDEETKTTTTTFDASKLVGDVTYTGSKKEDVIITGDGNDVIAAGSGDHDVYAGEGNNTLTYTSGEDEFYAGKGDDTYNVSFGKNTDLVITDDGGSDVLNLTGKGLVTTVKSGDTTTSTVNLTALFNVDKSGNVALTSAAQDADGDTYEDTDSLVIIDKNTNAAALKKIMNGKASGIVEIDNYFGTRSAESEHKYALGTGAIENINVGLSSADTTAWTIDDSYIDAVASAVGSWLTANNYEDAMAVFASDKTDDIASLLNVYTTGTYTAPASDSTQAGA